jgi:acyl carrier protein
MKDRVFEIMSLVFEVPVDSLNDESNVDSVEKWDSLQHMNLVFALEEEFGVMLPDDEVADMVSVSKILEVLKSSAS